MQTPAEQSAGPSDHLLNSDLAIARQVLQTEIKALACLADKLDESFGRALNVILETRQHLIVAGVGKSGHVGQKIAASFASTGTPSFFLHPTEASHGDLGMIIPGCAVLAISYSGETRELIDLLQYCRNLNVPVIGMTRSSESTLGRNSTIVLQLPAVEEACPNGLAPTSSTTMSLALGDALVVAAMERRGFSREDFGSRHPGGKLGKSLQTVGEYLGMHDTPVPTVTTDSPVQDLILAISEGRMGCAGVVDATGELVGMVTDGDLRRAIVANNLTGPTERIMTRNPRVANLAQRMSEVVEILIEGRIANLFIVEDGKPVGTLHIKDLLAEGYL